LLYFPFVAKGKVNFGDNLYFLKTRDCLKIWESFYLQLLLTDAS
jgi:hypothetical protein